MEQKLTKDEIQMIELMRRFNLNFEELQLVMLKGVVPAAKALGMYKEPPWSKEDVSSMDSYYHILEEKYSNLQSYLDNGNLF